MNIRYNVALIFISLLLLTGCDLTGVVSGTIVFEGKGLSGVKVVALLKDATDSTNAVTDANGNFAISDLEPGEYVVTPSKLGYAFSPESYTFTITEITKDNSNDPGIDDINKITAQDFTASMVAQDISGNPTLYSYDENLTIFGEQPSIYMFTYDGAGQIASVSRDVGQNGIIDSVDYYSYDEYGLLDKIERDSDNNRSANDKFDFTRDPAIDAAKVDLTDAETELAVATSTLADKESVLKEKTATAELAAIAQGTAEVKKDAALALREALVAQGDAKTAMDTARVAMDNAPGSAAEAAAFNAAETTYNNAVLAAATASTAYSDVSGETITVLADANTALTAAETALTAAGSAATAADNDVVTATEDLAAVQADFDTKSNTATLALDTFNSLLADDMAVSLDKGDNGTRSDFQAGTIVTSSDYEYDLITGDLLREDIYNDGVIDGNPDSTTFYNYDGIGNIVSVEFNDDNDELMDAIINYTYDAAYNVVAISRDDNYDGIAEALYFFTYDINNNISQVNRDDGADGSVDASNIYSYDANGFLIQIEQDAIYASYISNSIGFYNIELY